MVKLNLGCGADVREDWINLDAAPGAGARYVDLERALPFDRCSVHVVELCHVLEHVVYWRQLLEECYRILVPQGEIRIRVPDFEYAIRAYLTGENPETHVYRDQWGNEGPIDWHHLIFGARAGIRHESNPHVTGFSWDTDRENDLWGILDSLGFRYIERTGAQHGFEIGCKGVKIL